MFVVNEFRQFLAWFLVKLTDVRTRPAARVTCSNTEKRHAERKRRKRKRVTANRNWKAIFTPWVLISANLRREATELPYLLHRAAQTLFISRSSTQDLFDFPGNVPKLFVLPACHRCCRLWAELTHTVSKSKSLWILESCSKIREGISIVRNG